MRAAVLSVAFLAISFGIALADSIGASCGDGLSPTGTITLMRATGAPRTYLLRDAASAKDCPAPIAKCHGGYVLPGQEILASGTGGKFVCAFFPNKSGGSSGWIAADQLAPSPSQPDGNPPASAWSGKWLDGSDEIDISASRPSLHASGNATWDGGNGNVNEGSFEASATPKHAHADFVDDQCTVSAALVGRYLVVSDNGQCGGLNVRFDGVYQRAPAH